MVLSGFTSTVHISSILVFLEGVLSFFSPCVIPLIPVYMSFLAGNAKQINESGTVVYNRKKVFLHTLFFVLGISFAFFILGMTFSTLGQFFNQNKNLFTRISGIFIFMMGLVQLGFFDFKFLQSEKRFHLNLQDKEVNPLLALMLGFTFSFAWTPCIGPMLSSVLILASSAKDAGTGNILVLIYTLGFVIPFLCLGLFTSQVLNFLKSKQKLLKYTIKAGGIILLLIGFITFTGWMNGISSYLNILGSTSQNEALENAADTTQKNETEIIGTESNETDSNGIESNETDFNENSENIQNTNEKISESTNDSISGNTEDSASGTSIAAFDFTLTDQFGNEHTLSDYKGKVVFLNFWATWCPPCKQEMPHIQELYEEYNYNEDEVIILGVSNPKTDENQNNSDGTEEEVTTFLEENGYTFPVVYDLTGDVLSDYYINAFPTTFMIDTDGTIYGYVSGSLTKEIMINIIEETLQKE